MKEEDQAARIWYTHLFARIIASRHHATRCAEGLQGIGDTMFLHFALLFAYLHRYLTLPLRDRTLPLNGHGGRMDTRRQNLLTPSRTFAAASVELIASREFHPPAAFAPACPHHHILPASATSPQHTTFIRRRAPLLWASRLPCTTDPVSAPH